MQHKAQHILFILDRSGSMSSRRTDVIGGFNTYILEMKAEAEADGLETRVSLVTFSDDSSVVFAKKPVGQVEPLTDQTYRTMGNTALLDTVFDSVTKYREAIGQGQFARHNEDAPSVLVIIFTDGKENASTKTGWEQVQELIRQCEALGNWTFAYVGAHAGAWDQSSRLHVKSGNSLDAEHLTVREATEALVRGTKRRRFEYMGTDKKSTEEFFADGTESPQPEAP